MKMYSRKLKSLTFVMALAVLPAKAANFFEPNIECTITKVHSSVELEKIGKFPKLHQSINNWLIESDLHVAGHRLPASDPKTVFKTDSYEEIQIPVGKVVLTLELHGKPISRNGVLKIGSQLLGDVTCH